MFVVITYLGFSMSKEKRIMLESFSNKLKGLICLFRGYANDTIINIISYRRTLSLREKRSGTKFEKTSLRADVFQGLACRTLYC